MTNMSFIDKLSVLFDITKSSMTYLAIIIILIIIAAILMTIKRKNMKKARTFFILTYVMILILLLVTYHDNLANIFDYMMNNLFIAIYFPNLAIYLAAIIATNIILWTSLSNPKTSKLIKKINILVFTVITYILVMILNIINENKLDVFIQTSVYGNKDAQALIELSSIIFITWIIFLIIYKLVKNYILKNKVPRKTLVSKQTVQNKNQLSNEEITSKTEKTLPEHPAEVIKPKEKKEKPINQVEPPYYVLANDNKIKVEKLENETAMYDKLLTIDDYKLLLDVLKKAKQEQQEKKEREEKIRLEEEKLQELREIYQSIS